MAAKMKPDFLIQKRVALDNKFSASAAYAQQLKSVAQNTEWFESKTKYEFADNEKRSEAFIKQEMSCASQELKKRRHARLKQLYEHEARNFEDELRGIGLAVQRQHL